MSVIAPCRAPSRPLCAQVLGARNASAQMKAATALAVLAARSSVSRTAIAQAGAIPPLVKLLGDGLRVEDDTPQVAAERGRTPPSLPAADCPLH